MAVDPTPPAPAFRPGTTGHDHRLRRAAVRWGAALFAVVTIAALAGNDPGAGDALRLAVPSAVALPPASPAGPGGTAAGTTTPATGGATTGPHSGAGSSGPTVVGGGASSLALAPAAPAHRTSSPRPVGPEPTNVAVVSPTLRMFEFGSRVGMPLMCGVAASAASSAIPDPNVLQVVSTVVTSCIEFGHQGAESLTAMNEQLAALAALNPATQPVIAALVDAFNAAGEQPVPFAGSLQAMGSMLGFFSG
jgi:hypothetical protein